MDVFAESRQFHGALDSRQKRKFSPEFEISRRVTCHAREQGSFSFRVQATLVMMERVLVFWPCSICETLPTA